MKHNIYLAQVNNLMGVNAYLPYSVGMLVAYAKSIKRIDDSYDFKDLFFLREKVEDVVDRMENPQVVGVSVYIWNSSWSYAFVREVKRRYPNCLVVCGGPHVPDRSEHFFDIHPYVDMLVHNEGEHTFSDILLERLNEFPDYKQIKGCSIRIDGSGCFQTANRDRIADIDALPSPYLTGVFDNFPFDKYQLAPTQETNRGCPYSCFSGDTLVLVLKYIPEEFTPNLRRKNVRAFTCWKRITEVRDGDFVWDGKGWVETGGVVYRGEQQVGQWNGVGITSDHLVLHEGVWKSACVLDGFSFSSGNTVFVYDLLDCGPRNRFTIKTNDGEILVHNCSFCQWGSAVFTKVRKFSEDRIKKELDWFADKKTDLIFNADANYGIYERDIDFVKYMVEKKLQTGYPKKFRASFAKNSHERVYQASKLLNNAGMSKGATISFQSMDDSTLTIVKRKNVKWDNFKELMKRYNSEGIPTYSEMIIGMPGESYDSWCDGLSKLLDGGAHSAIHVYSCEVLPNSELNDPEYKERHGIKEVVTPVMFYHATPSNDPYTEYYHLVVATKTMSEQDLVKAWIFSAFVQYGHCMGLTQSIAVFLRKFIGMSYRRFYESLITWAIEHHKSLIGSLYIQAKDKYEDLLKGKDWGMIDPRFGNMNWPVEECLFLKAAAEGDRFYSELADFLPVKDEPRVLDLINYQRALHIDPYREAGKYQIRVKSNLHEYIQAAYVDEEVSFVEGDYIYEVSVPKGYGGDLETYSREQCWYARKGGQSLHRDVKRIN